MDWYGDVEPKKLRNKIQKSRWKLKCGKALLKSPSQWRLDNLRTRNPSEALGAAASKLPLWGCSDECLISIFYALRLLYSEFRSNIRCGSKTTQLRFASWVQRFSSATAVLRSLPCVFAAVKVPGRCKPLGLEAVPCALSPWRGPGTGATSDWAA